jgi:hypothetical protein
LVYNSKNRTSTTRHREVFNAEYEGGKLTISIANEDPVTHIADLRIYVQDAVEHKDGQYRNIYINITGRINMNLNDADNSLDIYDMEYKRAIVDIDNPDHIGKVDFDWKIYHESVVKHIKENPFKSQPVGPVPLGR